MALTTTAAWTLEPGRAFLRPRLVAFPEYFTSRVDDQFADHGFEIILRVAITEKRITSKKEAGKLNHLSLSNPDSPSGDITTELKRRSSAY